MASAKPRIHCRRILPAPALFLALWAVLLCFVPALAADLTNPAGTTIMANPGMAATADGDRLTNNGNIAITATGGNPALGMGDPNWASPHTGLILTNNGSIAISQKDNFSAYGMSGRDNSSLVNTGTIAASVVANKHAYGMEGGTNSSLDNSGAITAATATGRAFGMYGGDRSTLANTGSIAASATGDNGDAYGMSGFTNSTLANSGTITASATTGNAFGIYAVGGDNSSLTNSGSIAASATGDSGRAYGMFGGANSTLSNSGAIAASATGRNGSSSGMYANGANSSLANSGSIAASATDSYAYGMWGGNNSTLTNSGTIAASASGTGNYAFGMYANGDNSSLANSGTITAIATGDSGGAYGMRGDNSTLTNSGAITASATGDRGDAYGMVADGDNGSLANSGTITAIATGNGGWAYGMRGRDNSSLANSGTITASATTGWAYGMYGYTNSSLANSGTIAASATTGKAFGMSGGANSSLANSGTITASATGNNGTAWGMYAGNGSNSSLSNSGTITAITTGDSGGAYGMEGYADNAALTNNRTVTAIATTATGEARGMALKSGTAANYGLVSAIAANPANAWELYSTSIHPTDTVYITNWATDLRDFTTYKFFGSDGAKLDLTGSRLTLRPGATERGFAWGREYAVSDLAGGLANNWGRGAVASVTQEVPWVRARLTGTDWTDQKLSLHPNFTRKTNPGQGVTSQGVAFALNQMRGMDTVLDRQRLQNSGAAPAAVANSGLAAFPTASGPDRGPASGWSGFLTPYFSYVDNSDLDYDATIAGFMAGATRRFNDAFAAGVHLGFSHADVSADLADQDGEALTGLFGLHAIYNATPEWYLRGQLTGFLSRASNDWQSGLPVYPLYTDADINSRGLYASLATGYDWRINASNTITPEIGLSWLWSHQDSFSLDWKDRFGNRMDNYDLDYKAQDYNALYGTAMVRWRGEFALAGGSFQPALGVGVRQTLTDGDVKSRLATAGSSFSTKATEDETSALAEAGFVWQRGITSVGLTYTGGYGDDQVVHTGWLTLKLEF